MRGQNKKPAGAGLSAGEWLNIFRATKVEVERLDAAKSAQGRATIIGNFLARMVDREVAIEVEGRTGKAMLRSAPGRSRKVYYYFEVVWDGDQSDNDAYADDTRPPVIGKASTARKPSSSERERIERRDSPLDRSPASGLIGTANDEAW